MGLEQRVEAAVLAVLEEVAPDPVSFWHIGTRLMFDFKTVDVRNALRRLRRRGQVVHRFAGSNTGWVACQKAVTKEGDP